MTGEPKVTIEDGRLRLENFRITDPDVIAWLKAQPDLEEALSKLINTGVRTMARSYGRGKRVTE